MALANGYGSGRQEEPHDDVMSECGAFHKSKDHDTRWYRRDHVVDFLKNWFDPKPQLEEMCQLSFWKDMLIEAMALGHILVAVILLLNTCDKAYYMPGPLIIGLFAAFMIFSSIDGWGPMCGCLLNPAGIVGFYLCGRMSFIRAFFRILAEFGGAAAGAMIGYGLVPDDLKKFVGPLGKSPALSMNQAAGIEGILTFNLILVALSVTTPGKHTVMHTLTIGCCKATGLLAAGSYTGGIQNPAIAMGPAVASGNFKDHFSIYWVGPFIGGVVAAIVYLIVQFINKRDEVIKARQQLAKEHHVLHERHVEPEIRVATF